MLSHRSKITHLEYLFFHFIRLTSVIFIAWLIALFSFYVLQLCRLSFDLRLLIAFLVPSNFSTQQYYSFIHNKRRVQIIYHVNKWWPLYQPMSECFDCNKGRRWTELVNYQISVSQTATDMFTCRRYSPFIPSAMTYHLVGFLLLDL